MERLSWSTHQQRLLWNRGPDRWGQDEGPRRPGSRTRRGAGRGARRGAGEDQTPKGPERTGCPTGEDRKDRVSYRREDRKDRVPYRRDDRVPYACSRTCTQHLMGEPAVRRTISSEELVYGRQVCGSVLCDRPGGVWQAKRRRRC